MVNTFVSSQAARFGIGRIGVASLSILAHVGFITVAAVESGRPAVFSTASNIVPSEHLLFVDTKALTHDAAVIKKNAIGHAVAKVAKLLVPDLGKLRVAVDASLAA